MEEHDRFTLATILLGDVPKYKMLGYNAIYRTIKSDYLRYKNSLVTPVMRSVMSTLEKQILKAYNVKRL